MEHLSYIEVNVVSIVLLLIIFLRHFNNRSIVTHSQIYMKNLILTSCILCFSDILAISCRGQFFEGARVFIEISNLVYIEAMPLISLFWLEYVFAKIGKKLTKSQNFALISPIIAFTAIALTNPFTQVLFSIDENNLYARGPGIFLHWIVSWFYLIYAGVASYRAFKGAQSWNKKNQYRPLLVFIVAPMICCVLQMLVYGLSAIQVGITLSIVLVNFQTLDNRISIDELTGVNNRKEMNIYVDRVINKSKPVNLSVFMIDVNRFKQINDTLGHSVGDEALQDVAGALKSACEKYSRHIFLCRYGGDEFVVIGKDIDETSQNELKDLLKENVVSTAMKANRPYKLSISVGIASKRCENMHDFEDCVKIADERMYIEKEKVKAE